MRGLLLPLPKCFSAYCKYNLHESIPIWLDGCIKKKNITIIYADLFSSSLKLKALDKSSIDAIMEFTLSIINFKHFLNDLVLPRSDKKISEILIEYEYLSDSLKRNGILTINDLMDFGINNISKLNYIGNKKCFYIMYEILMYLEQQNTSNNDLYVRTNFSEYLVEQEQIIEEIEKMKHIPVDRFTVDDPRFINIKDKVSKLIVYEDLSSKDWLSVFYNISKLESSIVIEAVNEFKTSYNLIVEMSFEEQMEHLFILYIQRSHSQFSNQLENSHNFNVIKDRLGIIEGDRKAITLQEAGDNLLPPKTRERVRQVISNLSLKSLSFASDNEIYIPKLNQIKTILNNNLNTKVEDVVDLIETKNLGKWHLKRIFACFDLFNIPNSFKISNGLLTNSSLIKMNQHILRTGKKISKYNGAINLQHLTRVVNEDFFVNESDVEKVLLSICKSLGKNWFVCLDLPNHLYNQAQKLSNFAERFTPQDLRDAHIKFSKFRGADFNRDNKRPGFYGFVTPPSSVIGEIINHYENYSVSNGIIHCLRVDTSLLGDQNSSDYQFLKYFQARNYDVATNYDMKKYFVIEGNMAEASFYSWLTYKPYIKKYAPSIYGLVGHEPSEDSVLNAKNRKHKKIKPIIEWTKNGGILIRMQINNLSGFTFTTYGYEDYITTDVFSIKYGSEVYEAKKSSSFWYGSMSRHLRDNLMCELGDFVSIELDIETNEAEISLISESDYYV